jgi:hypothetical protein
LAAGTLNQVRESGQQPAQMVADPPVFVLETATAKDATALE